MISTRNYNLGIKEEDTFMRSVSKSHNIKHSTLEEDIHNHIDFWIDDKSVDLKNNLSFTFVDGRKVEGFFVELFNVRGDKGSIDGDADYIAFTHYKEYLFLEREELRNLIREKLSDRTIYKKIQRIIPYFIYQRPQKKDQIVFVPVKDILDLVKFKIERE